MRSPNTITPDFFKEHDYAAVFISGSNLHSNVQLYKYYWWIYPANSIHKNAGEIFYKDNYKLSTKAAIDLMEKLQKEKIPFAYVNTKQYRLGTKLWDYERLTTMYPDTKFALPYNDDMDEIYEKGHK